MNIKLQNEKFLKINELYAFISSDDDGEGIIGAKISDGTFLPFIGADLERVESLKPIADKICSLYGKKYEIRYFVRKE